jgi:chorismate synthase
MAGNSFGTILKLTTFGESHGTAIGGIIDGCPAGIHLDLKKIQEELDKRTPGQSAIVTQRKEADTVEFFPAYLKGKPQVRPLVLSFKIPIKNPKIIPTLKILTAPLMQIILMMKNTG